MISLLDIFNEFKSVLKEKIKKEKEYQEYSDIFNEKNIEQFKIDDVFSILEENLNFNDSNFSIIKKDFPNFNFLVTIITEFNELKDIIYIKDLDILF